MYEKPKLTTVCDAHFVIFQSKYAPTKEGDLLTNSQRGYFKRCQLRYCLRARMNAHIQNLLGTFVAAPTSCCWVLKDGKYDIVWFVGEQMPKDIAQNIENLLVPEEVGIHRCVNAKSGRCSTENIFE